MAEVELFVDDWFLDPDAIETPGIFVDSVVLVTHETIVPGLQRVRPTIDRTLPLDQVADVLAAMESGDLVGKIAITP